ncbi:MAG: hypothetical protein PXY39_00470, partial [archaeon]|nr:hypothetical protein [archaeon]
FTQGSLLSVIMILFYRIYSNPFVIDDAFGIAIQAILAYSVYVYARKVPELKPQIAFLVSIIFSFNLLTLRLTWDQYRTSFSLVCVIFTFIFLRSKSARVRYLSIPLTAVAAIFNPLPVVFLVFSVIIDAVLSYRQITSKLIAESACVALAVFLVSIQYVTHTVVGGTVPQFAAIPGSRGLLYGLEFFLYTAWPLLIFFPLFFIKQQKGFHLYWFYVILFFAFIAPLIGALTISSLWILWIAGFPLAIIFGQTLNFYHDSKIVRTIAALLLISSISISLVYVSSSPLQPEYLPSIARTFSTNTPPGYLQSTVPISQEPELMQVLKTTMHTLPNGSVVLLPEEFYGLAFVFHNPGNLNLTDVGVGIGASLTKFVGLRGNYIVWWDVSALPQNFRVVNDNNEYALYSIQ